MADKDKDTRAYEPGGGPAPDLEELGGRLVGTWEMSGEVRGKVSYEWMKGGFFLVQRVELEQEDGRRITGLEIIGHEKPFGSGPSEMITSRFYSDTGDTIEYVYELEGDALTIWAGQKGSPAYYWGTFGEDGRTLSGAWHYPGGGGYEAASTRVG